MGELLDDLSACINRHSRENGSNTPDFILAQYLDACLRAFEVGVQQRENWYGRDAAFDMTDAAELTEEGP